MKKKDLIPDLKKPVGHTSADNIIKEVKKKLKEKGIIKKER
jgi:hypothetical protein